MVSMKLEESGHNARLANALQTAEELAALGLRQRQRHARRETDGDTDLIGKGNESLR